MTRRRTFTCSLLLLVLVAADASAQEAHMRLSGYSFSFADPSAVGIRSYSMMASELAVAAPVLPWLVAGTALRFASAEMSSQGMSFVRHSGLTDTDVFAEVTLGRLRVRGAYALPLGRSTTSSDANVVAGLAGYELLPFPVRSWGTGGGYAVEVVLPVTSAGWDVEFSASTRRHGSFEPFLDAFDYRLGAETRGGIRIGKQPTALSSIEVGGFAVFSAPDESLDREVFEPGVRLAGYGLVAFPVGMTSVLMRGDLHQRSTGSELHGDGTAAPLQILPGATATAARTLVAATVETRTLMRVMPLTTRLHVRAIGHSGPASGWFASVGVGTEFEVPGPFRGRYFVAPMATVEHGQVTVAEGNESQARGWILTLTGRWEAGR